MCSPCQELNAISYPPLKKAIFSLDYDYKRSTWIVFYKRFFRICPNSWVILVTISASASERVPQPQVGVNREWDRILSIVKSGETIVEAYPNHRSARSCAVTLWEVSSPPVGVIPHATMPLLFMKRYKSSL
jgi:hypothetical protein